MRPPSFLRLPWAARPRVNDVLVAAAIMLAGVALYPWLAPAAMPDAPGVSADMPSSASAIAPLPPASNFSAVLDRPLFSPSRRPPARQDPIGSGLAGRYQLLGLISAGDARHALIADGDRRFEIAEGAALDGWTVARIEQDRVVLSSSVGRTVLTLRRAAAVGAETPAPAKIPR
jgi:hypothetical protein